MTVFRWLFQRHIHCSLPNPLWWLAALFVYPWRRARQLYRRRWPTPNYCQSCGVDVGRALWSFCSIACLERIRETEKGGDDG